MIHFPLPVVFTGMLLFTTVVFRLGASQRRGIQGSGFSIDGRHLDAGTRLDLSQRLHVAKRSCKDVAGRSKARFIPLRDRGAAKTKSDAMAIGPIGNLAWNDDSAGIAFTPDPHRDLEIDLLTPGHC